MSLLPGLGSSDSKTESQESKSKTRIFSLFSVRSLLKITGALIISAIALWFFDKFVLYETAKGYIDDMAYVFDINRHLASAITIALFAVLAFSLRYIFSIRTYRRRIGYSIVGGLLIANSLMLWMGTRNQAFTKGDVATKCYIITRTAITFGEHPGTDPSSGEECIPVTREIVEQINAYANGRRPARINSDDPTFFDRATGWPIVWYSLGDNGEVQLYDLMGFDPETGKRLLSITPNIVADWRLQRDQRKAEQERQKRRAPKPIDAREGSFFDPVTGKSRVWFWRDSSDGHFEFFDAEGFHPGNGQPLALVTAEVVADWMKWSSAAANAKASAARKAPQRIDPNQYAFFDPVSGKPRVWYWKSSVGDYEFYDADGFQQLTGQPLTIISPEIVSDWKRSEEEKERKRSEAEKLQRQKAEDAQREKQQEEDAKRRLEQQQAIDAAKAEQEAQERREKMAHAGDQCDADAANPLDLAKPNTLLGVSFDVVKANATEAVSACRAAIQSSPSSLRYKYQLARALQAQPGSQAEAIKLFGDLTAMGYAAAFDNLGWLTVSSSKNYGRAAALFRQGIRLGDPQSMASITWLFDNGYVDPQPGEDKWELLTRAAQLGNPGAQAAIKEEQDRRAAEARQQAQQQQQQQQVLQIMGTFIQALPRK